MKLSYDGVVKSVAEKTAKNGTKYYVVVCEDTADKHSDKITFFKEELFERIKALSSGHEISVIFNYAYSPQRKSFNLYANDFVLL